MLVFWLWVAVHGSKKNAGRIVALAYVLRWYILLPCAVSLGQSMDVAIVSVHVTCFLNATDLRHACDKSHISPPSSRPRPQCLSLVHLAFSHPRRQLSHLGHLLEGRTNRVKTSLFFPTTNPAARPISSKRPPRGGVEWSEKSAPLLLERYLRYPPTMSLHPSRLPNCPEIQVPAPYRNSGLKSICCKRFGFSSPTCLYALTIPTRRMQSFKMNVAR